MTKNYILSVLREDMLDRLKEPRWGLREGVFKIRSVKIWAANEILRVIHESNKDPERAILEFLVKIDRCGIRNSETRKIFLMARSEAETMLDIVRCPK